MEDEVPPTPKLTRSRSRAPPEESSVPYVYHPAPKVRKPRVAVDDAPSVQEFTPDPGEKSPGGVKPRSLLLPSSSTKSPLLLPSPSGSARNRSRGRSPPRRLASTLRVGPLILRHIKLMKRPIKSRTQLPCISPGRGTGIFMEIGGRSY